MRYILIIFAMGICVGNVAADVSSDIDLFVTTILQKEIKPTISDYHKFYGDGAEGEISILSKKCKKNNWVPVNKNKQCIEYINSRYKNKKNTESIYLKKIRKKLPLSPQKVTIKKVEDVKKNGIINHQMVYAILDKIDVEFFRTLSPNAKDTFGILSISKINNTDHCCPVNFQSKTI